MARLNKRRLVEAVLGAIRAAGWQVTPLSENGSHPVRFIMTKGAQRQTIRVYVWNLSHGGGSMRPKHEYRIQITGVRTFDLEQDGKTLVLGWGEEFGVFAAFDAYKRTSVLGASPSIQISEATLLAARERGAAIQDKGNDEFAVAVRPDRMALYIEHLATAHSGDLKDIVDDEDEDVVVSSQPHFGTLKELEERQNILQRLESLEQDLANLKPATSGRAHNHPPELLPADDERAVEKIKAAADDIKVQLKKPMPNVVVVTNARKILNRLAKVLTTIRAEAKKTAGKIVDKARERAADIVLVGSVTLWDKVIDGLPAVIQAITRWLGLL